VGALFLWRGGNTRRGKHPGTRAGLLKCTISPHTCNRRSHARTMGSSDPAGNWLERLAATTCRASCSAKGTRDARSSTKPNVCMTKSGCGNCFIPPASTTWASSMRKGLTSFRSTISGNQDAILFSWKRKRAESRCAKHRHQPALFHFSPKVQNHRRVHCPGRDRHVLHRRHVVWKRRSHHRSRRSHRSTGSTLLRQSYPAR
jgi:hypothetical protein